jgi:MFS transporter, DHA2 family, multidrug resistance protein
VLAVGVALGAMTSASTGDTQALTWIAISGLGLGLVLPTTIDTALGAVSEERSGVSSGVLRGLRMAGGALGAAILGAIINATYRHELDQTVSPALARSARDSVVSGVEIASATRSPHLLDAVRHAFVSGLSLTL